LQRCNIFISYVQTFDTEPLKTVLYAAETLKYHNNVMRYFDVMLLNDVILSIEPNISDCDTYIYLPSYKTLLCGRFSHLPQQRLCYFFIINHHISIMSLNNNFEMQSKNLHMHYLRNNVHIRLVELW